MATTTLTPAGVSLSLTGSEPIALNVLNPIGASLALSATTPTLIGFYETLTPAGATASLTGSAPVAGITVPLFPLPAAIGATGSSPTITGNTTTLTPNQSGQSLNALPPLVTNLANPAMAAIWQATREHKHDEEQTRRTQPLVRLWNGEWELQHVLGNEYRGQFSFISNDTGPGQLEMPFESPAAKWVHDHQGRIARGDKRNVFITIDHCGARWSGIMDKYSVEKREDGDVVLVMDFLHDYEYLKWYSLWSNPFLIEDTSGSLSVPAGVRSPGANHMATQNSPVSEHFSRAQPAYHMA